MSLVKEYAPISPKTFDQGPLDKSNHLDEWFPMPDIREPSEAYLRKLGCPPDLFDFIKYLSTPERVQAYIDSNVTYNDGFEMQGFVGVARTKKAHCFEGTVFAYTALHVWGYQPRIVMLVADNDYGEDHNIVVFRRGTRLGALAMSNWETLKWRPPVFPTLRDLVLGGYWHAYTSEEPQFSGTWNLIGFSDPIDLVAKFGGYDWMFNEGPSALWLVFQKYADDLICTHLFNGSRFPYPPEDLSGNANDLTYHER